MLAVAMLLGVMNARLVGMLVRVQLVAMRDMRMMGCLLMVARLVMFRGFVMMLGGLLVMVGGLAMMFSAFVSCRHIHVLREVITLRDQQVIGISRESTCCSGVYILIYESMVDNISVTILST